LTDEKRCKQRTFITKRRWQGGCCVRKTH
jgi:hypothetical protein